MGDSTIAQSKGSENADQGSGELRFYAELHCYFRSRVFSSHDSEDLTQETYARFFRWWSGKPLERPRALLFQIARNLLTDTIRRKGTRPEELVANSAFDEVEVQTSSPSEVASAADELELIRKAVEKLPKRCREVFILSRFGGMTYKEISDQLGISKSTVEKHIIKGAAYVRDALDEL
ncbi:MAG: RNA polymerase sigma factor [Verrucomicrobiota bacterium]